MLVRGGTAEQSEGRARRECFGNGLVGDAPLPLRCYETLAFHGRLGEASLPGLRPEVLHCEFNRIGDSHAA